VTVLNALDDDNKKRMIELLDKDAKSFMKVVDFSWEHVE